MHTDEMVTLLVVIGREVVANHRLWGTRCQRCGSLYEDHAHHGDLCPHPEGPCTGQTFTPWAEPHKSGEYDA